MGIDFQKIQSTTGRDFKLMAITSEIKRVGFENITITECLSNRDRDGLLIMKALQDHANRNQGTIRYKIRVLKDRWGKPVYPGDKVEWKFERLKRDFLGKKITNRAYKEAKLRGEERTIEIWHEAIVDKKGCIDVPFEDAARLLDTRGVHYKSGQPLMRMPETERFVRRDSYDKDYAQVIGKQHFWLYSEAPPDVYKSLPTIKKPEKNKVADETPTELVREFQEQK